MPTPLFSLASHSKHLLTVITATLALALAGCSSAPSLPAVSPNPTVSITSSTGRELLTATRLDQNQAAQLTAEVKQAAADPATAAALISELGGAGLLRAVVLGSTVKDTGLAEAVREAFQTGQPALGKDVAGRIASELTDGLNVQDATQKANHVLALSFLLQDSTLNPELLIGLAPGLIETDQQVSSEKKFWSSQPTTWADITGSASPSVKNLFEGKDWAVTSDVLASYLTALSRDGVAGLAVLTDTPLGATEPEKQNYLSDIALARQRYLIEQRAWSHDRFSALTAALDAAATSKETANTPLAAGLVSSAVEMLANRARNSDINGQSLGHSEQERFTEGNISDRAAEQVMHLVGQHLTTVGYYITPSPQDGQGNTLTHPTLTSTTAGTTTTIPIEHLSQTPHQPVLRRVDLLAILNSIATPNTTQQFRTYLDTHRITQCQHIATTYPPGPQQNNARGATALNNAALEATHTILAKKTNTLLNPNGTPVIIENLIVTKRFEFLRCLYNAHTITTQDTDSARRNAGITPDELNTIFPNGTFPSTKQTDTDTVTRAVLLYLSEETMQGNQYRNIFAETYQGHR